MAKEDALGLVARINRELDKAIQKTGQLVKGLSGGSNSLSTGNASGGSVMPGSLAAISTHAISSTRMAAAATAVQGVGNILSGAMGMMPDTGAVVARAGGYYGAALRVGGGMSRQMLQGVTFSGLGGGLTSAGSDAIVAGYLGAAGMAASGAAGSTFQQTLRATGNAAKYLNMDNLAAVRAIEGLTSGPGSGNMMNMYGIFTADPRTGKPYTQGQIFEQMAQRFSAGQPRATEAETLESLRRGALGSNIRNSGMSADQQALFAQYMIERSRGNYMDLSDQGAMDAMMKKAGAEGNANPFASAYRINTAQTGAMQSAESNYLKAIQDATPAIEAMNKAAGEFAAGALGYAKAFTDTLMGDQATSGAVGATGGLLQTLGGIAGGALAGKMFAGGGKVMGGAGKLGGFAKGFGLSTIGVLAGEGIKAATGNEQGGIGNKLGNALSLGSTGAGIGAMIGSVIPGIGTAVGAGIGGALGGTIGFFTGGEQSSVGAGGTTDTTGGFARPVSGGNISAYYGQKGDVWAAGYHKGTDFAVPTGTPVYAAASGVVSKANYGGGSHSFGLYVAIEHGGGYTTIYAHLSQALVSPGESVIKGQLIAKSGESGNVTGPHLHFEVRKNGNAVSPGSLLSGGIPNDASSGAGSNEGLGKGNSIADNAANSILDVVLGGGAGGSALVSAISFSTSGVKGNFRTTSQMVSAAMGTGISGNNAPVVSATGRSVLAGTSQPSAVGGEGSYIGLGTTSRMADAARSAASGIRTVSGGGAGNTVNITVNVARATEAEAMRLVELVKSHLEEDSMIEKVGRH